MASPASGKSRLAISVEFMHGVYRADPTGTANTGRLTEAEWPPAPSRLFAALVASDGTGERSRVTQEAELRELRWLEEQPPPVIHADAPELLCHQSLNDRYVVKSEKTARNSAHQEYVGRKGALVRPGVRCAPRHPHVTYIYDAKPADSIFRALQLRCARVGYLGTSDSPVRLRISTDLPQGTVADSYIPSEYGDIAIKVPAPGHLAVLDRMYCEWAKLGPSISRSHFPLLQHAALYQGPRDPRHATESSKGSVVAWLRIGAGREGSGSRTRAISGRRVSAVTALFKAAVLNKYQNLFGEPPPVLHGHGFKDKGYELARYLALPDVGFRQSRGKIHGLALWMPATSDSLHRGRARDAARAVRRLVGPGIDVRVTNHDGEDRPWAASPKRWQRKSRRWVTAFPAIHERRRPLDLDEVSRWCRHAGLPDALAFRSSRTPLVAGAVDLAPIEVNRAGKPGMPYSHVELLFAETVSGPIVIGSGRQRGFGMCVPVEENRN